MSAAQADAATFEIEAFLAQERAKDLLRFSTAGSVDDGKSTLIGRLLYDSRSVYEDHISAVAKSTVNRSAGPLDLSLLTDGLRAEREQGITIDVAYRYFATAKRKFIIADTPGHEQYTRNMATGASTADLAIILIDARHGVMPQSRRHAYIATLLGIPKIVVAVNKMDLVAFGEERFAEIQEEFRGVLRTLEAREAWFVPLSALSGDNVVTRSKAMPWFTGPSLLEYLEKVEVVSAGAEQPFRMPVQRVIRPDQSFRGYAGQIASGTIHAGDAVRVWPSGRQTRVRSIETYDGALAEAATPQSVVIALEDEVDISRGDILSAGRTPFSSQAAQARVVWMAETPLDTEKRYVLKHASQSVPARVRSIEWRIDIQTLEKNAARSLAMNDIGSVTIETTRPIFFDAYRENRTMGAAILIDLETNSTAAALMFEAPEERQHAAGPVTASERAARFGHKPALVSVGPRESLAVLLERKLFELGAAVVMAQVRDAEVRLHLTAAGLIVIDTSAPAMLPLPTNDEEACEFLLSWLRGRDILLTGGDLSLGEGI